ncbi:MAG: FKBP-type peptidyl-prolyl cis-trans isomerase [Acidimicrobiia bacterium]|nr:FKBP-type peptidyl-prolyl cis-trans isomerase [Acidimicrobiia bacterium]
MSFSTSWRLAAAALASVVVLAGCGSSEDLGGTVVKDGLGCTTEVELGTDAPEVAKVAEVPKKVVKKDLEGKDLPKGTKGCAADAENYLTLALVGATAKDGKVFTDTYADKRPVTAKLGTGQLLPGLESGLEGLKVGGRRQITIPADQAYGKEGNPAQEIGADQPLVFAVDLVAVTPTALYCNEATNIPAGKEGAGKPTEVKMPVAAPTKLKKTDLTDGKGTAAEKGNYVTVQYLGISCSSGQQFDSSWDEGEPLPVTLGEGTIPGFATGIEGMKVGGRRQIDIPAALAYGAAGQGAIAPNDPLTFIIEVTAIEEKPPATTTLPVETTLPGGGGSTTTAPGGEGSTTTAPGGEGSTTTAPGGEGSTTTGP